MDLLHHRVPKAFLWRRLHSLTGLLFGLYLLLHLITGAQAGWGLQGDGLGFVRLVNWAYSLPFIGVFEWLFLGLPFVLYATLGVWYALQGRPNARRTDGSRPSLRGSLRNHAYSWQKVTAWLLLVGVVAHVIHIRILERPTQVDAGPAATFMARVHSDPGLITVADRLQVALYGPAQIEESRALLLQQERAVNLSTAIRQLPGGGRALQPFQQVERQQLQQFTNFINGLRSYDLGPQDRVIVASNYGTALLLVLRNTLSSGTMCLLYTGFVLVACFHLCYGLWTSMISWGTVLRERAQRRASYACVALALVMVGLGLIATWGTYWFNLLR